MEEFNKKQLEKCIVTIVEKTTNYNSCSSCSLGIFVESLGKYLETLAYLCSSFSEHSGRNLASVADLNSLRLYMNLECEKLDQFSLINFDNDGRLAYSLLAKDKEDSTTIYTTSASEIHLKSSHVYREWMSDDQPEMLPSHVPSHMPVYPDRHSYKNTAVKYLEFLFDVYVNRETDPGRVREISAQKNRFIQASLRKLVKACDKTVVDLLGNGRESNHDEEDDYNGVLGQRHDIGYDSSPSLIFPRDPSKIVAELPIIHYERFAIGRKHLTHLHHPQNHANHRL